MFGRTISASDVQELIRDSMAQGYKFVTLLQNNEWALHNLQSSVKGKETVLKFSYWVVVNTEKNILNPHNIYRWFRKQCSIDSELKWLIV